MIYKTSGISRKNKIERKELTMDEQTLLHQISVDTDVNIELLKDLFHNEKMIGLIKAGKIIDATLLIRSIQPRVGLREAKMVVEAFAEGLK